MEIETERLILRPWSELDADDLYLYAKDPRVGPPAGWPAHTSVENSREVIRGVLSEPETYAVVLRETGKPIGSVGIKLAPHSNSFMDEASAELGCWIARPYWGKGLGPEALEALLYRCFDELGSAAVWCGYYDGNVKSARMQEKCGFRYHHTEADMNCALLGDVRTEHFTVMTKAEWEFLQKQSGIRFSAVSAENIDAFTDIRVEFASSIRTIKDIGGFRAGTREYLSSHIGGDDFTAFIARDGNRIAAACMACIYSTAPLPSCPNGRSAELLNVYTLGEYRRRGLAETLVEITIDELRRRDVGKLLLEYTPDGLPLYTKLGFEPLEHQMKLMLR